MENFVAKKIKSRAKRYTIYGINKLLRNLKGVVVFYNKNEQQEKSLDLINMVQDGNMLMTDNEICHLIALVRSTKKIPGDIAEIGAYMGRSVRIVAEIERNKQIHAFDTFEGLPDLTDKDIKAKFSKGLFNVSYDEVKSYLKKYTNVTVYKGIFPENISVEGGA